MKLIEYIRHEILRIIIRSVIILIMAIFVFTYLLYNNSKKNAYIKKDIAFKFLDNQIKSEKNLLRLIREDKELNIFIKEGTMLDYNLNKKIIDGDYYYRYIKDPLNKFRITSNQIFHIDQSDRDRTLEIYDKKGKMVGGNGRLGVLSYRVLENIDFSRDIGEQHFWVNYNKDLYLRVFGLSQERGHVIILNRRIRKSDLMNIVPRGIEVEITFDTDILSPWTFINRSDNKAEQNSLNLQIIDGKLTWVLKQYLQNQSLEKVGTLKYFIETDILKDIYYILFANLFFGIILIIGLFKTSNKNSKKLMKVIDNAKMVLETGNLQFVTDIEEEREILKSVEKYVDLARTREGFIISEVNKKTRELKRANDENMWENNFFKKLTKKHDQEEVMRYSFKEINKIKELDGIEFYIFPKEVSKITKISIERGRDIVKEEVDEIGRDEVKDKERELIRVVESQSISRGIARLIFREEIKPFEKARLRNILLIVSIILKSIGFYKDAIKDKLTGAYNRTLLEVYTKELINRNKRTGDEFTVLMLDIDHFKRINDKYGHIIGDVVLKHLVKHIQNEIREMDITIRYGGEEFVILLSGTNLEEGKIVAEKIREIIENSLVNLENDKKISYTISIGVTQFKIGIHKTIKDLINDVDQKMYLAKELGRNRVQT